MKNLNFVSENSLELISVAEKVSLPLTAEVREVIRSMIQFINTLPSPYGKPAGLAAPQVGISLSIALIQIPPEAKLRRKDVYDTWPLTVLINPRYEPILSEGKSLDWEACYSLPLQMGEVSRYNAIRYEAHTLKNGHLVRIAGEARGFLSRALQHEIEHLSGKLYKDLLTDNSRFGNFDEMWAIRQSEFEARDLLDKK